MRPREGKSVILRRLGFCSMLWVSLFASACGRGLSIDTDDGQVDPGWATIPFVTDPGGDVRADLPTVDQPYSRQADILQAWVLRSGREVYVYFRLEMKKQGDVTVGVQLDCDLNGSFGDGADIYATYDSSNDETEFGRGDRGLLQAVRPSASGERVGDNFEWSLSPEFGLQELNWEQCLTQADLRFYTFGLASRIDETETAAWSRTDVAP